MKILLNEKEVIELAAYVLDMYNPNEDKVHDIALLMDMVYVAEMDLYEDVEQYSLRQRITESNG